jgi:hypothetical protein
MMDGDLLGEFGEALRSAEEAERLRLLLEGEV